MLRMKAKRSWPAAGELTLEPQPVPWSTQPSKKACGEWATRNRKKIGGLMMTGGNSKTGRPSVGANK